jgi:hypothetical protein
MAAILYEFTYLGGSSVRVAAIDPESGRESVIIGPAGAARADLQRLARAMLERRASASAPPGVTPSAGRGGRTA